MDEKKESMRDPVCGMSVSAESATRYAHAGQTYAFCSESCMNRFKTAPESYVGKTGKPSQQKGSSQQQKGKSSFGGSKS